MIRRVNTSTYGVFVVGQAGRDEPNDITYYALNMQNKSC